MTAPRVEVGLPDLPWLAVPADVDDAEAWARGQVDLLSPGAPGPATAELAAGLAVVARHAAQAGALACAALLDVGSDDAGTVPSLLAVLVVDQVAGADTGALRDELAAPTAGDVVPPDVSVVTLPLGAAVRARTVTAPPEGAVLEAVDHLVPLGDGTALRAQLSWLALGLGEPLQEVADEVAQGLRLVR